MHYGEQSEAADPFRSGLQGNPAFRFRVHSALQQAPGVDVNYCFDRKEVKDHGEGGMFVGKTLEDGEKVVIIEDVMTSWQGSARGSAEAPERGKDRH